MISLDKNESYWMLDDELIDVVNKATAGTFSTYPDYKNFKDTLATYANVSPEQILITPGSDAAIEYIAKKYTKDSKEFVLPVPTFYGYENILNKIGSNVIPVAYEIQSDHFVFPLEQVISLLKQGKPKVLFVCQPNNPLGTVLSKREILAIVETARASGTIVVSDEAYFEFSSGNTFFPYLSELSNLIIIRTFSKTFGLAGARVGYALSSLDIVKDIGKDMRPWEIAHPSIAVASALLKYDEKINLRRNIIISARERLIKKLRLLHGVIVYPSETNFILIRISGNAVSVSDALLKDNIRVANGENMSNFPIAVPILKDTLRIAIPDLESEDVLINTIKKVLNRK